MEDTTNNQTSTMDATNANPIETITETTDQTIDNSATNADIDYKVKFSESSKEGIRLAHDLKVREAELEALRKEIELAKTQGANYSDDSEQVIPGFDTMSVEEQNNLLAYTNSIRQSTLNAIYKDPAIADAKNKYNENVWSGAFQDIVAQYPELNEYKDDFKTKYFRNDNVPSNIKEILGDIAKVYLFDKARDIGAKQALEQSDRIDTERAGGGEKAPAPERTIEDWQRLSKENPVKFAAEYRKSQQK